VPGWDKDKSAMAGQHTEPKVVEARSYGAMSSVLFSLKLK